MQYPVWRRLGSVGVSLLVAALAAPWGGACGGDGAGGAVDVPSDAAADALAGDEGGGAAAEDGGDSETPDAGAPDVRPGDVWRGPDVISAGPIGGDRPAAVHLPGAYDPAEAWPLVVVLHGFGADGWTQDVYFQTSELRDEVGAIVLVPDGTENADGDRFWNATSACCDFYDSQVDDAGYLLGLIAEARALWHIDRVVLVGHSNGGFMAHQLACDAADRITAIASLAGSTFIDPARCQPSQPVAMLQIHGTADATIPYAGTAGYPGAAETAARWAAADGCAGGPEAGAPADFDLFVDGPETTPATWSGCSGGVAVALWTMDGSGHIPPPNQPDFGRAILQWLLAQPR
jgi:polyhydroxybutyrate depolymerase